MQVLMSIKPLQISPALWEWIQIFPFLLLGESVSKSWPQEARNPICRRLQKAHHWWGGLCHSCVMRCGHWMTSMKPASWYSNIILSPKTEAFFLFWSISQINLLPWFHRFENTGDQSLRGIVQLAALKSRYLAKKWKQSPATFPWAITFKELGIYFLTTVILVPLET